MSALNQNWCPHGDFGKPYTHVPDRGPSSPAYRRLERHLMTVHGYRNEEARMWIEEGFYPDDKGGEIMARKRRGSKRCHPSSKVAKGLRGKVGRTAKGKFCRLGR